MQHILGFLTMTKKHDHKDHDPFALVKRKLNILWLQVRNGEHKNTIYMVAAVLGTLLVMASMSSPQTTSPIDAERGDAASQTSTSCRPGAPGFGAPVASDVPILKAAGYVSVGGKNGGKGDILRHMRKIEHSLNSGWNHSDAKIVPLGQSGYVKRDIPVYKAGFQAQGFEIAKRSENGMFSAAQLEGDGYNGLLCLSFNTDFCFDTKDFPKIPLNKKINRLSALRDVVWSKNKFCRTINAAIRGIDIKEYTSFTFQCWVMPSDYSYMVEYSQKHNINQWIVKPRSLGAGMGIFVVNDLNTLSKERRTQNVIQPYMTDPHLIKKVGVGGGDEQRYKWDLRTYVLVTSILPLRAYVYSRGLVRFATTAYAPDVDCGENITACLTNTSLNKKVEGAKLKDITWSLYKLEQYFKAHEEDEEFTDIFLRVQQAIGLTLLSSEGTFQKVYNKLHKGYNCENCYHLLGVDVMFDSALEPKIVEINGEPSLRLTSLGKTHYDITKKHMAKDMVNIVYNRKSACTSDLVNRITKWGSCVTKKGKSTRIGRDHIGYILDTFREHENLGKFLPVYPNNKLASTYHGFLSELHKKEAAAQANSESKKVSVHADGRRLRLHELITVMQNDDSPIFQSGGGSAASGGGGNNGAQSDYDDSDPF